MPKQSAIPKVAQSEPEIETAKMVEAQHTIKFQAPFAVPGYTDSHDADSEFDELELEDDSEPATPPQFKPQKSSITKLREKLVKTGVVPEEKYPVIIEKFNSATGSGLKTPRTPCTRLMLSEDELTTENIMSAVESYGPGRYWLTIRNIGGAPVIRQWETTIDGNNQPSQNLPPAFINQPLQPDPFQEIDRVVELVEKLERIRGSRPEPHALPPDPKAAVASFLMDDPATAKKVIGNLLGGASEPDSTLGLILQNAEPIGKAIESIITSIFLNIQTLKSDGQIYQQVQPQQFSQPSPHADLNHISENPTKQFAVFLVSAINSTPNLNTLAPDAMALQLIAFSDYIDAQNGMSISHYLEMIGRTDTLQACALVEQLAQQKITAAPNLVNHWVGQLQQELLKFFTEAKEDESNTATTPN